MNHIYRTIWNASTNTWAVVSENTTTRGKRSGPVKLAALAALLLSVLPTAALAQATPSVTVSSGTTNAYVAPNGVTVVDIAAPNATGLSHNQFTKYNVNPTGLILNNGNSDVMARQSQLAGQITANLNLTRQASVILNEVVSNNRSTLAGFTEVLGGRADVVLANPYGITCSGCGFINTDRVTLTTGSPFFTADGGLGGFNVEQGDILIAGKGLNATAQQLLDLVTRSARIEARVNAVELGVTAGANRWDYGSRTVTGGVAPVGSVPAYAIDTSEFGGMYANRIRLVATEAGVGVRMLGDAAANADDFALSAAGKIELQNHVSAARDITVNSASTDVSALALTDASLTSTGKTTLATAGGATIKGGALVAGSDLGVSAASLFDSTSPSGTTNNNLRHAGGAMRLLVANGASLGATEWSADDAWDGRFGTLATTGNTRLSSSGSTLIASAEHGDLALGTAALQAAGDLSLRASGGISTSAGADQGVQSLAGNLALTAGNGIVNAGGLSADKGTVTIRADGTVANSGQIHAAQNLDIADSTGGATASLANSGTLQADQSLMLKAAEVSNAAGARMQARTGSTVNAASIDNAGAWLLSQQAGANGRLTVSGALVNSGTLQGAGSVALDADSVRNSGSLLAAAALTATTTADFSNSGTTQAGSALGVTSGGVLANTATGVLKAATLNLAAATGLNNTGIATADAGNATLRVGGTLSNSGQLHAKGDIDIADRNGSGTQAVSNSGQLLAEQALTLNAASFANTASGQTQAVTGSTVTTGTLDNAGTWLLSQQAGAKDQIDATGAAINSGTLQSAGDLGVTAASLVNSGAVLAATKINADITGLLSNAAGGALQAGTALTLTSTGAVANAATAAISGQTVAVIADNGLSNAGAIESNAGATTLHVNGTLDNSGTVHATTDIDIADRDGTSTQTVTNSGTLLADQAFALKAANMTNAAVGRVQASTGSTVATGSLDNQGVWLLSQQATAADAVNVTGTLGNSGVLQSAGDEVLTANQLTNSGQLLAGGNLTANLTTGLNNNGTAAVIQAGNQLSVQGAAAALATANGSRMLGDGLAINVASLDNAGTIQGGTRNDSTVSAQTLTNRTTGTLSVATALGGAGTVAATTVSNDGKIQSAGALTLGVGAGGLTSNGTVIAERDLTLQNRSGNNYAATVNGLMQSRSGTLAINGTGSSTLNIGATGTVVGQQLTGTLGTINLADDATLSSDRDMTLTLGTLGLAGANAAVLGSTDQAVPSQTRITTSNALANIGLLFSGNDLTVSAPSITNSLTGGIAALHNLSVTANTGDLMNQGALYAGNALTASAAAGTLTNAASLTAYQGAISAGSSVNLSADTLVNNSTIDSNGAITITARELRNEVPGGDSRVYGAGTTPVTTQTGHDGQGYNGHGCCDQYESWYYSQTWHKDQTYSAGTPTIKPQITGAGAVGLNFNVGKNLGGVISGDTVTLTGTGTGATFTNDDLALQRTSYTRTWTEETKYKAAGPLTYYDRKVLNDNTTNQVTELSNIGAGVFARVLNASNFALINNGSTAQPADIKKGGAKSATVNPVAGASATKGTVAGPSAGATGASSGTVAAVTTLNGHPAISFVAVNAANGVQGTSFGGINIPLPSNPNGLYVITQQPGAKYLIESNPRYQVGSSTVGSDYLARLLGYNPDEFVRQLGDSSYEAYLIKQQLIAQTGNSLLAGVEDAGAQVQGLMDSAVGESKVLGLVYGQALTPEQQANLKQDIVWMVQTEIDGQVVLAPVVYLAQSTRDNLATGAVISAQDANLSLTSLTNSGGTIAGSQSLKVVSAGDVTNTSGTIKGGNVAITSTDGSIINQTAANGSGGDQRYVTDIGKTASIESTGSLALDAAKDITNKGANVTAGGDAALKAGGNVTFDTIENKTTDTTHSSYNTAFTSGSSTTTTTTINQVKSGLTSGGNLTIDAGKDITLAGTDAKAAGNAALTAGGDLNIVARENSKTSHTESQASGLGMNNSLYGSTEVTTDSTSGRNVGSTLQVGGNADLTAKNDVTVQGSNVDVKGNGQINATNVNVLAGRNYDESHTTKKETGILQVGASSGSSASASAEAEAASRRSKTGASASASAGAKAEASGKGAAGLAFSSTTTTKTDSTDLKHVGSNLSFGGDLVVNASKDVNLQGSKVNAGGDATVNAQNVNLLAAEDKSTSSTSVSSTKVGLMASTDNTAKADAQAGAGATGGMGIPNANAGASANASVSSENHLDLVQKSDSTKTTLDTTHQGSAITAGGDLNIKASDTLNVEGSKLASGGDMNLDAKDMSFKAVDDQHETRTTSSVTTAGLYATGNAEANAKANATAGLGAQAGASVHAGASGEVGIYGSNTRTGSVDGSTKAQTSSISAGGSITRKATNDITDVGTQIEAGGDLNQSAKTITSLAAADTTYSSSSSKTDTAKVGAYAEASFDAGVSANVGPGASKPTSKSGDKGAGIRASYQHDDSSDQSASSTAVVSNIKVGGSVNSQSSGKTSLEGTNIAAGKDVTIGASSLDYSAASNTSSSSSDSTSAGGSVKVDIANKSVGVAANYDGSKSSDASSTAVVGGISAGGNLNLTTTGDTRLEGTNLAAGGAASVTTGGKLDFAAAKNTSSSSSRDIGVDVGVTVGAGGGGGEAGVNYAQSKSKSSDDVVGSIQSGSGPLTIKTGGDATFTGTNLASDSDIAVDAGGNLAFNAAHNTASSEKVDVGASGGASKGKKENVGGTRNATTGKKTGGQTMDTRSGEAAVGVGYGKASSDIATGSSIQSGGNITLSSGKNTVLEGTQASAAGGIAVTTGGTFTQKEAKSTSSSLGVDMSASASGSSMTPTKKKPGATTPATPTPPPGTGSGKPSGAPSTPPPPTPASTPKTAPGTSAGKPTAPGTPPAKTPVDLSQKKGSGVATLDVEKKSTASSTQTHLTAGTGGVTITQGTASPATRTVSASVPIPAGSPAGMAPKASTADGKPLPAWLKFDPATGKFTGKPPSDFKGELKVSVNVPQADGSIKAVPLSIGGGK